jgi:hypothetical protein
MIRFKEIRLFPTLFYLDVFIIEPYKEDDEKNNLLREKLSKLMSDRYGAAKQYYYNELESINWVNTIKTTDTSIVKSERRIVLVIEPKIVNLIHENVHVLHHLSEMTGLETDHNSTEWNAYFLQYLFEEINDFEKITELK